MSAEPGQLDIDEPPSEKLSTPGLEDLLRGKYPRDRYAMFFDVPDSVSLQQKRRIDAIAFGMWASGGHRIEGFELKVSRSDWLRELKQVDKADPFISICDHFWLVTADSKIAKLDEVPACWGWMSATKTGLRVQRPATKLPGVGNAIPRGFMLGVLRKMQDDLLRNPDVQALINERVATVNDSVDNRVQYATRHMEHRLEQAEKVVKDFEEESGIKLDEWRYGNVGKIVKGLKELGYGGGEGINSVSRVLESQENQLRRLVDQLAEVRKKLEIQVTGDVRE